MVKYKSYLKSKTFWSLVVAVLVALYDAVAPLRHWPPIPPEVFGVLTLMGIWGVRTANSTILLPGQVPPVRPDNVVPNSTTPQPPAEPPAEPVTPAAADQKPAFLPVPVEAAPAPGDPMNFKLLTLLSSALALGSSTPTAGQATALATWADQTLPTLRTDVQSLGTAFAMPGVIKLIGDTVTAANGLAGAFVGLDRAEVVAVVVRFVLTEFTPASALGWLTPLLASGTVENLIESVYRQLFPVAVTAPVTDAPELPSGTLVTQ
jgi:hypothetical protein